MPDGVETASTPNQSGDEVTNDMAPTKRTTSPAFQFYAKDFLSSSKVQRMSLTEIGAYIILLAHNWLSGGIPSDPSEIAKLVKVPPTRFRKMWAGPLSECFAKRGAHLANPRLEDERRKQIAFRERQSENGKRGGRPITQALPKPIPTSNPSLSPRGPSTRVMEIEDRRSLSSSRKENDVAFAEFRDAYPLERRKGGFMVEQSFVAAVERAGGFDPLMAALANHKRSEQWANPRMIPGMDTWLSEERWRQTLTAKGAETPSGHRVPQWLQDAKKARKAAGLE